MSFHISTFEATMHTQTRTKSHIDVMILGFLCSLFFSVQIIAIFLMFCFLSLSRDFFHSAYFIFVYSQSWLECYSLESFVLSWVFHRFRYYSIRTKELNHVYSCADQSVDGMLLFMACIYIYIYKCIIYMYKAHSKA